MSGQLDGLNDLVLDVIVFFWNVKHHHGLLTVIHCQWFKADDAGIIHHRGYEPKALSWDKTRNTLAHVQASDAAFAPTVVLRSSPLQDWEKKRRWYVWVNSCAAQSLGSVTSVFQLCPEVYLCNCSCSLNTGGHSGCVSYAHCGFPIREVSGVRLFFATPQKEITQNNYSSFKYHAIVFSSPLI